MSDQHDEGTWPGKRQLRRALRPVLVAVVSTTLLAVLVKAALAVESMLMLDLALPARSGETIAGVLGMMIGTLALLVGCLALRQRLLRQAGYMIAFRTVPLTAAHRFDPRADQEGEQVDGRDVDHIRVALNGGGVAALADAAALPLYGLIALPLGWPMALTLLIGGGLAGASLIAGTPAVRRGIGASEQAGVVRDDQLRMNATAGQVIRQLRIIEAMRMRERQTELAALQPFERLDQAAGRSKLLMTSLIALVVVITGALAVWQATDDRAGVGTIAATLLITGFALWPFRELAVTQVDLIRGRGAWRRLSAAFKRSPFSEDILALPAPRQSLEVEGLAIAAAGERRVVLHGGTFDMTAGDIAVVVGPSDTGKSMLLRALAGLAPKAVGNVRLDGATLAQYGPAGCARHIGYMSQQFELFPGTISENIAGFDDHVDPDAVVRAAQTTGAHDFIVRLPLGYDTVVGGSDCTLAHSVRQRIALTRAFFGDPFLILLDSPDSFQDRSGRDALARALLAARARGAIVLVAGDSAPVIEVANLAMVLRKGGIADFGPKDEVRQRMQVRERIKSETKPDVATAPSAE